MFKSSFLRQYRILASSCSCGHLNERLLLELVHFSIFYARQCLWNVTRVEVVVAVDDGVRKSEVKLVVKNGRFFLKISIQPIATKTWPLSLVDIAPWRLSLPVMLDLGLRCKCLHDMLMAASKLPSCLPRWDTVTMVEHSFEASVSLAGHYFCDTTTSSYSLMSIFVFSTFDYAVDGGFSNIFGSEVI